MPKTKSRFVPTLFVVAILGVAAWLIVPSIARQITSDRNVAVTVDFVPANRSGCPIEGRNLFDSVSVSIKVGPDNFPIERICKSPLIRIYYPRKGETVQVRAEQFYGAKLRCVIHQVGNPNIAEQTKNGSSSVLCTLKVI